MQIKLENGRFILYNMSIIIYSFFCNITIEEKSVIAVKFVFPLLKKIAYSHFSLSNSSLREVI